MAAHVMLNTAKMDAIIRASGDSPVYLIHDGVEYGVYQEFTDSGHPSLRPAFDKHAKQLGKALGEAIEGGAPLDDLLGKVAADIQHDWAGDVNVDTGAYKNSISHKKVK